MKKQIVCINWGTKYGSIYINRLYSMVERNITPPFRFVCFCDDSSDIRPEVECHPLPELDFEIPKTKKGIWPKSRLWNKNLADLKGPFLFLDLDLIITNNLDVFFEFGDPDDVVLAHNPTNPFDKMGQTSVYRAPVGKLYPLLEQFSKNPLEIAEQYGFEQRYVTQNAPEGIKMWPKSWVKHFRRHCRRPFPLNYFLPPKLTKGAKIVIFPGDLEPQNAIDGVYYRGNEPHLSPKEHIIQGISGNRRGGLLKHLRHYILPTKWVKDYWK